MRNFSLKRIYIPVECVTVDPEFVGYRGRIPGRTYIPSKSRKYGLKIFWACESNTGYGVNAIAYGGKEGNRVHHNFAHDIVLKVVKPWYGTGRDICTYNYFTSYTLANQLLQQSLTLLDTVRRHHRKVLLVWRQKNKLYRSKFIFNHRDGIFLVTYQAKRNKKPIILLSSSNSDPSVNSGESKKSRMILEYNTSKCGVDTFDQNLKKFILQPENCPLASPILFQFTRRCCKQRIHINAEEWLQKFSEKLSEKADIGLCHTLHTISTVSD